ncbi:hypothetical protein [Gordonia paraffinivorans]|uniref:hypothetical protein n=1 Tax=Gordonia paraffinivorans TaxID=175628 RepID=UPI0011B1F6EF|nr:hypothetical protein [Gordonia paraffinivorans]
MKIIHINIPEHLRRRKPRSRSTLADEVLGAGAVSTGDMVAELLGPGAGDPLDGHNLISKADMVDDLLDEEDRT